jgi:hypothetical protein
MADKKRDFSEIGYVLGIVSIVLAFFQPLAGIIIGVIGYIHSKKQKEGLSKKARVLNLIGIIVGIVILIALVIMTYYLGSTGVNLYNFPTT